MKNKEYNYPIDYTLYSIDEVTDIINFLTIVEDCYLRGVSLEDYKAAYKNFKKIVRAKSEENTLFKEFKEVSGFDGYLTTKMMKEEQPRIKINS